MCAISPKGDKIFVSNLSDNKVLTLARDGTMLHTFADVYLIGPCNLHVNELGRVLVCGSRSNTIVQLDREGKKKLATLDTRSDGLEGPCSVFYNRSTASFIVGLSFSKIHVFKVK
ncbi:hypothetical protein DPMN_061103 [Dreissena polymorpha]|uniref:Uncharacterized protein n=1 Tax=Dreissena polymorpha TaxID=45954 RepID=A0A9D4C6U1_DREPO|nr:hypothetical protein DPMN_061103 [Dreissena polymorpha]